MPGAEPPPRAQRAQRCTRPPGAAPPTSQFGIAAAAMAPSSGKCGRALHLALLLVALAAPTGGPLQTLFKPRRQLGPSVAEST
jgi:hypothetical protein